MSEKSSSTSRSPNCIDTLIGAGMRIDGDIACTGVLRVQGDILGNVSCHDNPNGTLVVDSAGSVTGKVDATHVSVRGRVVGPVQSSQSIEIHQGASLVGDVSFNEIAIHAGGIVEGLLKPTLAMDGDKAMPEQRPRLAKKSAVPEFSTSIADVGGFMERLGGARKIGVIMLSAVVVTAVVWKGMTTRPADDVALRTDSSLKESSEPKSPPAAGSDPRNDAVVLARDAAPLAPSVSVGAQDSAQLSSADSPVRNPEAVIAVRGANPNRPAGVFLLISNEPSILYRKKRGDPGEGARITVAEGEKISVAIAPDELIRVAKGRDISILFQGQKVSRSTIESGSWISFVAR